MSTKVKFEGVEYWLQNEPDGDFGALAPLEHCDKAGNILPEHWLSISFAHLYPNGILSRFGFPIGTRADLEIVAPAKSAAEPTPLAKRYEQDRELRAVEFGAGEGE